MSAKKTQTDQLLLIGLGEGNKRAFRKLFDLFWEPMFQNAISRVKDAAIAKDIVQNIWVVIWQQRQTKEIKNFEAYVSKAVRYGCYKYFRDNRFNNAQLQIIESLEPIIESNIEEQIDFEETQNLIDKALKDIPPRCRQIIKLSYLEEVSNEDIAFRLGISKKSVENQKSRALNLIRENLNIARFILFSFYFFFTS